MPKKSLIFTRLSIMMFFQFFLWGSWYVTAYLFLGKIGFAGGEIKWTYSVGPIAGMISPFIVGMIADRFFSTEKVLGVMHLLGGAAMIAAIAMMGGQEPAPFAIGGFTINLPTIQLTQTASPLAINLFFFGHMLCYFPTLALTNTLALHNMTNAEKQFPLIRVFGTIGWIVAGLLISWQGWDAAINLFYVAALSAIVMGLYSFTLPHTPPPSAGKKITAREILGIDALVLLKKPSFLVFMVSSFLICIPLAFYYQMGSKFADHSGLTNTAFKMSFGQMSEIGFMLVMPLFFARLGVKWMLFIGMLAWVARYVLFALGADNGVVWTVLSGIVLHGICYDFFFVTGQIYTDKVAPSNIRGQAQGMLVLFTLGLGMLIGAQAAGMVEEHFTPTNSKQLTEQASSVEKNINVKQYEVDEIKGVKDKPFYVRWSRSVFPLDLSKEQKSRVNTLTNQIATLRQERSGYLLKSVHWKWVWALPAIFAGIIMVLFAFVFKDNAKTEDGISESDVAKEENP